MVSASADSPCPRVGIESSAGLEGLGVKLNDLGCRISMRFGLVVHVWGICSFGVSGGWWDWLGGADIVALTTTGIRCQGKTRFGCHMQVG